MDPSQKWGGFLQVTKNQSVTTPRSPLSHNPLTLRGLEKAKKSEEIVCQFLQFCYFMAVMRREFNIPESNSQSNFCEERGRLVSDFLRLNRPCPPKVLKIDARL